MDEVGLSPQEKQLTVFVIDKEIQASTRRAAFREARTATGSSAPSRRPSSAGADGGSDRRRLPTQVNELQQHLRDPRDLLDQYVPTARQATSRTQDQQATLQGETRRWL